MITVPGPAQPAAAGDTGAAIHVTGLRKRYGDVVALADVDLVVRPGEFFTLLGPSGSGKTTLLRLIAGFERPDGGRIELGGSDVTQVPPYARNVKPLGALDLKLRQEMGRVEGAHSPRQAELPVTSSIGSRPFLFLPPSPASMIRVSGLQMEPHVMGGDMDNGLTTLCVQVAVGPDGDAEEVAQAALKLRRELLDLDVDVVEVLGAGEPPPGSRAIDVAALGALVVKLADSQLLAAVIAAVRSWLAGSSRRSIKLELGGDALELTGVSFREQRRLTDEWLDRHTSR